MVDRKTLLEPPLESFPHLSQAPIVEAVIDLRVITEKKWNPESLCDLLKRELPDYPGIEPQRLVRAEFTAKPDSEFTEKPDVCFKASTTDLGLRGYLFRSEDKNRVAQFQRDGFAFSRLKPYQDWEQLVEEAHRLWNIYKKHISVQSISRLGVRFINRIEAPLKDNIEDYLVDAPKPPGGLNLIFNEFIHRDVFEVSNTPYKVILNRILKTEPAIGAFIVDIDVSTTSSLQNNNAWNVHLNQMRYLKNKVFFESVIKSVWEGMK